jgi:hypothetical protein
MVRYWDYPHDQIDKVISATLNMRALGAFSINWLDEWDRLVFVP